MTYLLGGFGTSFICPYIHILGRTIATDELIFFRGVGIPPTRRLWIKYTLSKTILFPLFDGYILMIVCIFYRLKSPIVSACCKNHLSKDARESENAWLGTPLGCRARLLVSHRSFIGPGEGETTLSLGDESSNHGFDLKKFKHNIITWYFLIFVINNIF